MSQNWNKIFSNVDSGYEKWDKLCNAINDGLDKF